MKYSVGFGDKEVIFTDRAPVARGSGTVVAREDPLSVTKVLQIAENTKTVYRISTDPQSDFQRFCAQFRRVDAAGGVVTDADGNMLLIFRNGRWDLPKGHREAGETFAQCAVRETREECGVDGLEIVGELTETYHFYGMGGGYELKKTVWFVMRVGQSKPRLHPQAEEGIVNAAWVSAPRLAARFRRSYATIREVFRAWTAARMQWPGE